MFDASVKTPVGVEYGVEYQFGNFDQCIEISANIEPGGADIESKYCLVDVKMEGSQMFKAARRNKQVSFITPT